MNSACSGWRQPLWTTLNSMLLHRKRSKSRWSSFRIPSNEMVHELWENTLLKLWASLKEAGHSLFLRHTKRRKLDQEVIATQCGYSSLDLGYFAVTLASVHNINKSFLLLPRETSVLCWHWQLLNLLRESQDLIIWTVPILQTVDYCLYTSVLRVWTRDTSFVICPKLRLLLSSLHFEWHRSLIHDSTFCSCSPQAKTRNSYFCHCSTSEHLLRPYAATAVNANLVQQDTYIMNWKSRHV